MAAVVGSAAQLAACLAPPGPHQGATMHSLPPAGGRPAVTIQHYKLMQAPKEVQVGERLRRGGAVAAVRWCSSTPAS